MKADFQKLSSKSLDNSFVDFWVQAPAFGFHWHYHPEMEICYVKQGRGKRIIGESIEDFESNDLVLVGSNVPHSWITDEQFNTSEKSVEVFVIQFGIEVFQRFEGMPEFYKIEQLLLQSGKGLFFRNPHATGLVTLLQHLSQAEGLGKLLKLVELLRAFTEHGDTVTLNPTSYKMVHKKHQEERILKVCNYIHEHYRQTISITELADIVAMNNASFCRFFKRILGKTVVEYINELRISHVCNQIQNTGEPMYRIAYDTGYSSIAYFNKQFKKSTGLTPTEYRSLVG
ncbi:AraC family transcriptional regulator [Muricauda sp. SCSIO 64092]|uniref:helix-turn-helix domain-containing protein n=1 Tax=Allomuricauda sp. SCSIO 64092 TaxID=2908842 RepID=UPI001FF270DA|nr:AraC family transcriptional regulator [Muricauda sp. SCSIO 64092]UOY05934.1 AraC family transcriptional regulator [Muricauda sp. SCSIO 64092]